MRRARSQSAAGMQRCAPLRARSRRSVLTMGAQTPRVRRTRGSQCVCRKHRGGGGCDAVLCAGHGAQRKRILTLLPPRS